jgi:hypothetical protein
MKSTIPTLGSLSLLRSFAQADEESLMEERCTVEPSNVLRSMGWMISSI